MKKGWIKSIVVVLVLVVCYFAGQARNNHALSTEDKQNQEANITVSPMLNETNDEGTLENNNVEKNQESVSQENSIGDDVLVFEGNNVTQDNPWGITAGYVTIEEKKYIFLTPNTSVYLNGLNCSENLDISYGIHNEMKEYSDGAGLLIWVLDSEDNIIYEEEFAVSNEAWTDNMIWLSKYESAERIRISCNNGLADNDDGDWVLIEIDEEDLGLDITEKIEYVKAVHYFSDSWPIDFWNSELDELDAEMQQIREDG